MAGLKVPVLWPDLGCMYSWTSKVLVDACFGSGSDKAAKTRKQQEHDEVKEAVNDFVNRLYYNKTLNSGLTAGEKALNYAVTNIMSVAEVVADALRKNMRLREVKVEPCRVRRLESECMIVKVRFAHPEPLRHGREYQFTVDVTGCPLLIGEVRSWALP